MKNDMINVPNKKNHKQKKLKINKTIKPKNKIK